MQIVPETKHYTKKGYHKGSITLRQLAVTESGYTKKSGIPAIARPQSRK